MLIGVIGGAPDPRITVAGVALVPLLRDEPMYVMRLPVHPSVSDLDFVVCLAEKARAKYYAIKAMLSSKAALR